MELRDGNYELFKGLTKVTQQKLLDDTTLAKSLSINGFPSLVLRKNNSIQHIKIDYNQPKSIINQIIT